MPDLHHSYEERRIPFIDGLTKPFEDFRRYYTRQTQRQSKIFYAIIWAGACIGLGFVLPPFWIAAALAGPIAFPEFSKGFMGLALLAIIGVGVALAAGWTGIPIAASATVGTVALKAWCATIAAGIGLAYAAPPVLGSTLWVLGKIAKGIIATVQWTGKKIVAAWRGLCAFGRGTSAFFKALGGTAWQSAKNAAKQAYDEPVVGGDLSNSHMGPQPVPASSPALRLLQSGNEAPSSRTYGTYTSSDQSQRLVPQGANFKPISQSQRSNSKIPSPPPSQNSNASSSSQGTSNLDGLLGTSTPQERHDAFSSGHSYDSSIKFTN